MVPVGLLVVGADELAIDVAFPVLHGPKGEDGTVQGMFEICDLPYVGCDVLGSALSMDKDLTKRIVAASGIDTAPWITVTRSTWDADRDGVLHDVASGLAGSVFVKPAAQGSSVGIARVDSHGELAGAIANAFRYDDKVVVEEAIDGREIEVAVLDGPIASEPGEVVLMDGWYTYDAKYADETSRFDAPAELGRSQADQVRALAETIFGKLGLNGLARIDFFLERSSGRFVFNEVNTMPGFTSISGFPKMWMASGMTYPQLCDRLVVAAQARHAARSNLAVR
jgi:D-alanine-D-alanine ligase